MTLLEAIDIWKRYRSRWVLKGVDINLYESNLICLYGENGTGKTTLIKILAGLLKPSKGRVKIYGFNGRDYRDSLGVLLHENILYDELTIKENISYYSKLYSTVDWSIIDKLKHLLGLDTYWNEKIFHLSFGWRKRANILKAFINNPKIVLLDEPFTGLDQNAYKNLVEFLDNLRKGRAILFTLSNRDDVQKVSTYLDGRLTVFELKEGRIHEYQ